MGGRYCCLFFNLAALLSVSFDSSQLIIVCNIDTKRTLTQRERCYCCVIAGHDWMKRDSVPEKAVDHSMRSQRRAKKTGKGEVCLSLCVFVCVCV